MTIKLSSLSSVSDLRSLQPIKLSVVHWQVPQNPSSRINLLFQAPTHPKAIKQHCLSSSLAGGVPHFTWSPIPQGSPPLLKFQVEWGSVVQVSQNPSSRVYLHFQAPTLSHPQAIKQYCLSSSLAGGDPHFHLVTNPSWDPPPHPPPQV
jgi:hypothetical protein